MSSLYLTQLKEAIGFAEDIGSPRAKVHLDTFHMNIEEDNMYDAIAYAGVSGRLGHVHVGESIEEFLVLGAKQYGLEQDC